ncbi:hypothetical protein [Plantactinospora sp. B5E13]|uniref:hypothetical protein n=1 Tax=Plantactinospora sp. B5E13 TaxID=3153758 RepID=UPI00325E235A
MKGRMLMAAHTATPDDHSPVRPTWHCSCGDRRWPCPRARELLLLTVDRISLAMYAANWMTDAARDLPELTPAELFQRFLQWTRK